MARGSDWRGKERNLFVDVDEDSYSVSPRDHSSRDSVL